MARGRLRSFATLGLLGLLAACGQLIPEPRYQYPQTVQPAVNALTAGLAAGPQVARLGISGGNAAGALNSFRESCSRLVERQDVSGLTRAEDWQAACVAAAKWPEGAAGSFFATYFETVQVGNGQGFVTGYYEPEIAGVRQRQRGFDVPIYAPPPDLVRARPGEAQALPDGRMPLGRYDISGAFRPYYARGEIDDGVLMGRGLEIGWAADPVELFFLQIQGSGRLRAPDGRVMRIGYAGQNGYPFSGIGALMRERGLIGDGPGQYPASMQGMMRYLREHPDEGRALMRENKSYVFFQERASEEPLGALGVPVRARSSVAVDPAFVPLGAPVWLSLDRAEANGLWVAQDTGGAIKGANRFDSFWGDGAQARHIAGGMSGRGKALLLVPKGTLARLQAR